MAPISLPSILIASAYLLSTTSAATSELAGTWSTKSGAVLTGPGFYNPVNDSLLEPTHTGFSYSFTTDGYYEEAYYRVIANPATPSCVSSIMQWQHGTYVENSDGSLTLTPFSVDGRQLLSAPCDADTATYTRYNQTETLKKYSISTDAYTKLTRLDLYEFDGTPLNPMYLAYSPPLMLPTQTMNPTASATSTSKAKRWFVRSADEPEPPQSSEEYVLPLNKDAKHIKRGIEKPSLVHRIDLDLLWWAGVGMTIFGGAAYLL
ncbi:putative rot1 protein [Rutstroemia sp. NJR-2017a BBW]|nr:putative rot1 protein [Rutstroemia sp. NJR-2017a BBW]